MYSLLMSQVYRERIFSHLRQTNLSLEKQKNSFLERDDDGDDDDGDYDDDDYDMFMI